MKILKFIGSFIYGIIMYYLLWLFFTWITPYIMNANWTAFIIYIILAGGTITMFIAQIANLLAIPLAFLTKGCKAAKYPPILFGLYFGYNSVIFPWVAYTEYGVLQWLLAISLTIPIIITFVVLMIMPFKLENE